MITNVRSWLCKATSFTTTLLELLEASYTPLKLQALVTYAPLLTVTQTWSKLSALAKYGLIIQWALLGMALAWPSLLPPSVSACQQSRPM